MPRQPIPAVQQPRTAPFALVQPAAFERSARVAPSVPANPADQFPVCSHCLLPSAQAAPTPHVAQLRRPASVGRFLFRISCGAVSFFARVKSFQVVPNLHISFGRS